MHRTTKRLDGRLRGYVAVPGVSTMGTVLLGGPDRSLPGAVPGAAGRPAVGAGAAGLRNAGRS